jgi:predicted O-methyltransferase YrrM
MENPMVEDPLTYFQQWIPYRSELMHTLENEALAEQIPIVGPVVGKLLYIMARLHIARTIVELGTATGYSTLFLGQACLHTKGRIITFEMSPELAKRAHANIKQAGLDAVVQVRCENALAVLGDIKEPADMIFMDIEKEDYIHALPECTRLLRSGGLLFADNTGFRDAHTFNKAIHSDPAWDVVNIWSFLPGHSPNNDGICIALKR